MTSHPFRRFIPRLEVLEDRLQPAVTVLTHGNVLTVKGDNNLNSILVVDNGTGVGSDITIRADGQVFTPSAAVAVIRIVTFAGDDDVEYQLNNRNLRNGVYRTLRVDGGTGIDSLTLTLRGELSSGSRLTIDFRGGPGDDTLTGSIQETLRSGSVLELDAHGGSGTDAFDLTFPDGTVSAGSALILNLDGGSGADTIFVEFASVVDGQFQTTVWGGSGKDRIAVDLNLNNSGPRTTGRVTAQVFGGAGNDRLKLAVHKLDPITPIVISALLDGGRGRDFCEATANVVDSFCEKRTIIP